MERAARVEAANASSRPQRLGGWGGEAAPSNHLHPQFNVARIFFENIHPLPLQVLQKVCVQAIETARVESSSAMPDHPHELDRVRR